VCRTGLKVWRRMRKQQLAVAGMDQNGPPPVLLHLVERSSRFSGNDDVNASGLPVMLQAVDYLERQSYGMADNTR
jgi:hypothetical protein